MNILQKIIADKQEEVKSKKELLPISQLVKLPYFNRQTLSLRNNLLKEDTTGIIAEFKRQSPSKGIINNTANITTVTEAYSASAAGISILTDEKYFGGSNNDILYARRSISVPVLRKEFIIDEYQLYEAKAIGADVILLIAANLSVQEVSTLAKKARELSLEVLLEIHDDTELRHICDEVTMVGVNNRNLKTFEVDITTSLHLIEKIPAGKPAVAESGISNVNTILTLRNAGFKGFLIGENFMKHAQPSIAFTEFVSELKAQTS